MLDNNTTTSTLSSSSNNNNTSLLPPPQLSLIYQLASDDHGSILPNAAVGGVTWYNLYHYEENGSLLSMGYYARRNFNVALESLLYCIIEACSCAMEADVTFTIPYDMSCNGLSVTGCAAGGSSNNGRPTMVMTMSTTRIAKLSGGGGGSSKTSNVDKVSNINNNNAASSNNSGGKGGGTGGGGRGPMVNGISLSYDPTNGELWTMVCKYLLTNVKWLITYAAKHC